MGIQDFGPTFDLEKFYRARDVARDLAFELSSHIRPGMREEEAHVYYKNLCQKHDVSKNWHPPKIRFGPNTLKNFKETSEPVVLKDEDIFFIDIGPVVDGHEADYGETFAVGASFDHKHIADTAKKVFDEVAVHWKKRPSRGPELYEFARERAKFYGYELNLGMDGHRLGDFPHHLIHKGALLECEEVVVPNAWILEIHLWRTDGKFGAFFEDILR